MKRSIKWTNFQKEYKERERQKLPALGRTRATEPTGIRGSQGFTSQTLDIAGEMDGPLEGAQSTQEETETLPLSFQGVSVQRTVQVLIKTNSRGLEEEISQEGIQESQPQAQPQGEQRGERQTSAAEPT